MVEQDRNTEGPDRGTAPSAEDLVPLVYNQLRSLARGYLRRERGSHPLQATALVHEAFLRLTRLRRIDWRGKTHFFAVAATEMRRVLVDHARASKTAKRGTGGLRITLDEGLTPAPDGKIVDLLALDEALSALGRRSARQSRVAELHLFAGLTFCEIAEVSGTTERTARQDWTVARAWLARALSGRS